MEAPLSSGSTPLGDPKCTTLELGQERWSVDVGLRVRVAGDRRRLTFFTRVEGLARAPSVLLIFSGALIRFALVRWREGVYTSKGACNPE
jgi:hypothetical protein